MAYFTHSIQFLPGQLARGDAVDSRFTALVTSFANVETDVKRAIKVPTSIVTDQVLPAASVDRANRYIGYDATGDVLIMGTPTSVTSPVLTAGDALKIVRADAAGAAFEFANLIYDYNDNIFVGPDANPSGNKTTTATEATAVGALTCAALTNAAGPTFVGYQAGQALTSGADNTGLGKQALNAIATGTASTAVGSKALILATGNRNTAVGAEAGAAMVGNSDSTLLGYRAGYTATGGTNTIIGASAGANIVAGVGNVIIGNGAGPTTNFSNGLFINNAESDTPLIHGNFSTNVVSVYNSLGVGKTPTSILDMETSAPVAKMAATTGTNAAYWSISNTATSRIGNENSAGGTLAVGTSAYATYLGTTGAYEVQLGTSNTVRMTITSAGLVGFGEASPDSVLHATVATAGTVLTLESTEAGVGTGPDIVLHRNSASPADNDAIGAIKFYGEDDVSNFTEYARVGAVIRDVSNGTEDADLILYAMSAGTMTSRVTISAGMQVGSPTGGDQGAGTGNFENLYINADEVPRTMTGTYTTASLGSGATDSRLIAHNLGSDNVGVIAFADGSSSAAFNLNWADVNGYQHAISIDSSGVTPNSLAAATTGNIRFGIRNGTTTQTVTVKYMIFALD